jgi:hypothetical protein
MKGFLLTATGAALVFCCSAAHADNPNVPASSPYAVMESGLVSPQPYEFAHPPAYRRGARPFASRAVAEPNYVHDTAPPPGLMFDQLSTIGGYPIGY